MIPAFDIGGGLPPGVHVATWDEIHTRYGTTPHRRRLLEGLAAAIEILRAVGCRRIYLGGSFVTSKRVPNDYDVAWEPIGADLSKLRSLEPVFFRFDNSRAAQKAKFLGEFFPSSVDANAAGNTFLEFFQIDKDTGDDKGIIALDL